MAALDELIDFYWYVHVGGYWWTTTRAIVDMANRKLVPGQRLLERCITPGYIEGNGRDRKHYEPLLEHPALFRVFVGTDPTEEGVLAFANTYGRLGEGGLHTEAFDSAEPLATWTDAIATMRGVVETWDAAVAGDDGLLGELIRWDEERGLHRLTEDGQPQHLLDLSGKLQVDLVNTGMRNREPTPEQRRIAAMNFVQAEVSRQLARAAPPALLWYDNHTRLRLHLKPETLLGALWLQFAQAISGNKAFRQCVVCGTWYELDSETARKKKNYCSDACRSKAYRDRKLGRHSSVTEAAATL
jgi:hypothetical protein